MEEYTLQDLYDACAEVLNDLDKIKNDLNEEISNGVCDDLEEMFEYDINKGFYDSTIFKPRKYRRKKSLLKAYDIKKTKNGVVWDFGSKYMQEGLHRADNEYIFQNSFVKGFHGGADKIKNVEKSKYKQPHPDNKTPYWRKPYPDGKNIPYQFWYDEPAPQESDPPIKKIERDIDNYLTKHSPTSIKKYYEDRVNDAFSLIEGRYKLFNMIKRGH